MVELLLAVSFAVGVSAMCSLFEAVLYSVPYSYLDILSRGGSRAGELFTKMRQNVERPISAILTLNTVANTFGAAVAGAAASVVFGKEWLGLFSAVFTLSILLFSEIIPKTLGVRYAKGLARVVAWPLYLMQWVFTAHRSRDNPIDPPPGGIGTDGGRFRGRDSSDGPNGAKLGRPSGIRRDGDPKHPGNPEDPGEGHHDPQDRALQPAQGPDPR